MDNEELLGDVVASIVEKTLMNAGLSKYSQVRDILADKNITFGDCYKNPEVLNFALKHTFSNSYQTIIEEIRNEIGGLADDDKNLALFFHKLSK